MSASGDKPNNDFRAWVAVEMFISEIDAIIQLHYVATPEVTKLDESDSVLSGLKECFERLTPNQATRIVAIIKEKLGPGFEKRQLLDSPDEEPPGHPRSEFATAIADLLDTVVTEFQGEFWLPDFVRAFEESITHRPRLPLMLGSILGLLVAAFETLMGSIFEFQHRIHPEALGASEFTLTDLINLSSIDEAVDLAVERSAQKFLHGDLDDWAKWLRDKLRVNLENQARSWELVREIFQRRHVIVHNGGRVSQLYLDRQNVLTNVPVGYRLTTDREYLDRAIDELTIVGIRAAYLVWDKVLPGRTELIVHRLTITCFEFLLKSRWEVAKALSESATLWAPHHSEPWLIGMVNTWLCRKRTSGTGEIRDEVGEWQVGSLSVRFKLAKAALLDDLDQVFELLPVALQAREVTRSDMWTWPLLAEMRADRRFASILPQAAGSQDRDPPGISPGPTSPSRS